jgi:hypothetical protein
LSGVFGGSSSSLRSVSGDKITSPISGIVADGDGCDHLGERPHAGDKIAVYTKGADQAEDDVFEVTSVTTELRAFPASKQDGEGDDACGSGAAGSGAAGSEG